LKRIFFAAILLIVHSFLFSVDLSTQHKIFESEDFAYYAEDANNYTELIELVEIQNKYFKLIFKKEISQKIDIYIFKNQISFSQHVFNSETPVQNATGLADHVSMRFYITSFYDTCKPRERLLQTPIHELVHLFFPSSHVWIREGIACYYSNMLTEISLEDIPDNFSEIHFYSQGVSETEKAYNSSGWIIKYIIEELLSNDIDLLREYERNPTNYSLLGYGNEIEFFDSWKIYMTQQSS